jgi:nitrite reductase (NADH) small subunit
LDFVRVADLTDVPPGSARTVPVGRFEVALFNVDGTLYALENACPHQGGPIAEGWVEGLTVVCPWHAWCFDLRTGDLTLGAFAWIPRFEVKIENGAIWLSSEPEKRA